MMNTKRKFNVRDLVYISVLSTMCVAATSIKIPFGVGAMVHLGTAFLFIIATIYGGIYAGLSGAIGSALYDLIMGFSPYTLWSFVIKGFAGFIAGTIAKGLWPENIVLNNKWFFRAVLSWVLAAAWTLGGYVVAWWMVTGSLTIAVSNIPSSLMTSGAGFVVALFLVPKLRKMLIK